MLEERHQRPRAVLAIVVRVEEEEELRQRRPLPAIEFVDGLGEGGDVAVGHHVPAVDVRRAVVVLGAEVVDDRDLVALRGADLALELEVELLEHQVLDRVRVLEGLAGEPAEDGVPLLLRVVLVGAQPVVERQPGEAGAVVPAEELPAPAPERLRGRVLDVAQHAREDHAGRGPPRLHGRDGQAEQRRRFEQPHVEGRGGAAAQTAGMGRLLLLPERAIERQQHFLEDHALGLAGESVPRGGVAVERGGERGGQCPVIARVLLGEALAGRADAIPVALRAPREVVIEREVRRQELVHSQDGSADGRQAPLDLGSGLRSGQPRRRSGRQVDARAQRSRRVVGAERLPEREPDHQLVQLGPVVHAHQVAAAKQARAAQGQMQLQAEDRVPAGQLQVDAGHQPRQARVGAERGARVAAGAAERSLETGVEPGPRREQVRPSRARVQARQDVPVLEVVARHRAPANLVARRLAQRDGRRRESTRRQRDRIRRCARDRSRRMRMLVGTIRHRSVIHDRHVGHEVREAATIGSKPKMGGRTRAPTQPRPFIATSRPWSRACIIFVSHQASQSGWSDGSPPSPVMTCEILGQFATPAGPRSTGPPWNGRPDTRLPSERPANTTVWQRRRGPGPDAETPPPPEGEGGVGTARESGRDQAGASMPSATRFFSARVRK